MEEQTPKKLNPFQYMGYFLAGFDMDREDFNYEDFIDYCKFKLCESRKVLMKDPVWDRYSEEEILREYYAMVYTTSEEQRKLFEAKLEQFLGGVDDDTWFERQISQNRSKIEELKKTTAAQEDVEFDPTKE